MVDVYLNVATDTAMQERGEKSKDKDERRNQRMGEMVKMVEGVFK